MLQITELQTVRWLRERVAAAKLLSSMSFAKRKSMLYVDHCVLQRFQNLQGLSLGRNGLLLIRAGCAAYGFFCTFFFHETAGCRRYVPANDHDQ